MTRFLLSDNTVLNNFALIHRMDLLETLLNGNGAWCASVAGECAREAETIALVESRGVSRCFLTDDREATRVARVHKIPVATTFDMLRLAVRSGRATVREVYDHLVVLDEERRGLPRQIDLATGTRGVETWCE